ncbi:MAG: hypothetical protein CMD88_04345 [Gammaproteobacteria bacterium]|nr:hypothetical protein [Gammaproteobacteria bacterium]|tara:strand:- start:2260 stop:2973 length:714 start_codon:yes stop_codon:yes gene_type:complete
MKQPNKLHRIYLDTLIELEKKILIKKDMNHRLNKVLRIKKNENIIIFNGNGYEYISEVKLDKDTYIYPILRNKRTVKTNQKIILAQCISAIKSMELSIQKAVELGVDSIIPVISKRSHEGNYENKISRWHQIIIHATEQSNGLVIPTLQKIINFDKFLEQHSKTSNYKILYDSSGRKIQKKDLSHQNYTILVGPEGGFTNDELQNSMKKYWNILGLGDRILRTETASVVGHTLIKKF